MQSHAPLSASVSSWEAEAVSDTDDADEDLARRDRSSVMSRYAPPKAPVGSPASRGEGTLRLLAAFFALYGLYCAWWTIQGWSWSGGFSAAVSMATAVGLWLRHRWSQYFVYFFSAMILCNFAWSIWALMQMGWPYEDNVKSIVALVPGSLILLFGVGAGIHVFRVFRTDS